MPRKRESWELKRARELDQQAADRRQREAILASQAAARQQEAHQQATEATPPADPPPPATETAPEASQEAPEWSIEAWQRNCRVTGLMRARFGPNWASNRRLERLAQRALADLNGSDSGKALRHLRTTTGNGSYADCLDFKYGPIPTPIY